MVLGDDLRERVLRAFRSTREQEARDAIPLLTEAGSAGAALVRQLWQEVTMPSVRRWLVEAAAEFEGAWVRTLIRDALRDPAMTVRLHALIAIGAAEDRSLARAALPLAQDESGGIRTNCIDLLATFRVPGYRSVLEAGLEDPKPYIRKQCRRWLDELTTRFPSHRSSRTDRPARRRQRPAS